LTQNAFDVIFIIVMAIPLSYRSCAFFISTFCSIPFRGIMTTLSASPLMEGFPQPLILGSGSFTRKLILKEMEIDFVVIKRPIDESSIGDRLKDKPQDLVLTLAKAKCQQLVKEILEGRCSDELPPSLSSYLVLTGDQVVVHDGKILEKPSSIDEAKVYCAGYGSSPPSTVGSCVITHVPSGLQVSGVDAATIYFRPTIANSNLVDRLLEEGAPILDCAGGLMIEHELVREHLDRIDGTEDSVMGLSKDLVKRLLEELRIKMKNANLIES
jgi:septum formation protein